MLDEVFFLNTVSSTLNSQYYLFLLIINLIISHLKWLKIFIEFYFYAIFNQRRIY